MYVHDQFDNEVVNVAKRQFVLKVAMRTVF